MQLVIDISKSDYEYIKKLVKIGVGECLIDNVYEGIRKGIVLPEGHGKLKDVDALYESSRLCHTEEDGTACVEWRDINDAPTIIEADGGDEV